jgi:uncharacterized cupredoxin-like copper-binding protein
MATTAFARIGAVVVLLLAGACGGDDAGNGDAASDAAGGTTIDIETHDFGFDPTEWTAPADSDVVASVTNSGPSEHEWVIVAAGEDIATEDDFTEEIVEFEVEAVPSGETGEGTFNLPAGTYQIICALDGHFSAGMEGQLTLE